MFLNILILGPWLVEEDHLEQALHLALLLPYHQDGVLLPRGHQRLKVWGKGRHLLSWEEEEARDLSSAQYP
jgi:hypothetical protein